MDDVHVVFGSLVATALWWPAGPGGGSDPIEIWRVERLCGDLSACPPVRGWGCGSKRV